MQALGGPVPSMRTQHKSLRNLVLQARPLLAQAPLTFLFCVHLTVAWEVTRSKKSVKNQGKNSLPEPPLKCPDGVDGCLLSGARGEDG